MGDETITLDEWKARGPACDVWAEAGAERSRHLDIASAIEEIVDGLGALPDSDDECIVVEGWTRRSAEGFLDGSIIERALESLDDEFGDPDGGYSEPTPAMREAEAAFIRAVLAEYPVWSCYTAVLVRVPVLPWVRDNCPGWLEADDE